MSKSFLLIVLTFAALVGAPSRASALPIPEGMAETLCKGKWITHMEGHVRICAYCEKTEAGTPKCDYFVCDDAGCDWITVERKEPTAPWKVVQPKLPKTSVAPKK